MSMFIGCTLSTPLHVSDGYENDGHALLGLSNTVSFTITDLASIYDEITSAKVYCVSDYNDVYQYTLDPSKIVETSHHNDEHYYAPITESFSGILGSSGKWSCWIRFYDSNNNYVSQRLTDVGTDFYVDSPKWENEFTIYEKPPLVLSNGTAVIDFIRVYKWDANNVTWKNTYSIYTSPVQVTDVQDSQWSFKYTFTSSQVERDADKHLLANPEVKISLQYKYYDAVEKEWRTAFFSTTRNQNYSNGIYNVMFVSGVTDNPDYSSRTWWSEINNPLYFPDNKYLEVGSNDTAIVGLTKVGDYLAVIKQSKTTDTAIYLLYPTSFEEETTFAVKQGVQGVGALARYAFNILGSETLFLSPNGVMSIVPTDDEEHKVQNRSYFIDGKLLKEDGLADAYSFVFDGKYWLSVPNEHDSVYVLDGNQRNSWGNDRTNLVYECYYLENVPARSFAKYGGALWFTDGTNVCKFNDGFTDAYNDGVENVPVFARWSTVLDDDNSLHYYKTMQKKGNLVSVLPLENQTPYVAVTITQTQFEDDPTKYFILMYGKYERCSADSVYDAGKTYYIENRTATKVYVRKDGDDRQEVNRLFGLSSDIPSEMILKKKVKKYKRLQIILENDADENFGVDSIIKSYSVGNYAKK